MSSALRSFKTFNINMHDLVTGFIRINCILFVPADIIDLVWLFCNDNNHKNKENTIIGFVTAINCNGLLIIADNMSKAYMYEAVLIGKHKLIGEIIRLHGKKASIQIYSDSSGMLSIGDIVIATRCSISVELGPGLIGNTFDALQRNLNQLPIKLSNYNSNLLCSALNRTKIWKYTANSKLSIGDEVEAGDLIGIVYENNFISKHKILIPPKVAGKIISITESGEYNIDETLMIIKHYKTGKNIQTTMTHFWPVRFPRPCLENLPLYIPLITGQRVLDALFPMIMGGTCMIPGAFGSGKTELLQSIAKYNNADCVIFVGCGQRGNEITKMIKDFNDIMTDKGTIMDRTCFVVNTCNMPFAAHEAAMYTGITIAEYYRDQGLNVVLLTDGISRWAQMLAMIDRKISHIVTDNGYPSYLATRFAAYCERAGYIKCLGSDERVGSLSIINSISPTGGDFADPVVSCNLNICHVSWTLDVSLTQKRHYPAVNCLISFTNCIDDLKCYLEDEYIGYSKLRKTAQIILQTENDLNEIAQLVGRDSLSEDQKLILDVARMIKEEFLQQDVYTKYDYYCPMEKTLGILRCIITYYQNAKLYVESNKCDMNEINEHFKNVVSKIGNLKIDIVPTMDKSETVSYCRKLIDEIETLFDEYSKRCIVRIDP